MFLDNDAFVSPGWLARMLYHLEVDPLCACVGPLSDRAAHGQQVEYGGGPDLASVEAFARRTSLANPRGARHASLLSSFCLLVRRSLVDEIGGFDERFSPWGFEDDDFTLRASLSGPHGRHNRIALDVFVRHEGYRGRKLERHQGLLERNWERFRAKWGLPAGAAHGDYTALAPLLERGARPCELPITIDSDVAGCPPADEHARTKRCATS